MGLSIVALSAVSPGKIYRGPIDVCNDKELFRFQQTIYSKKY